MARGHVGTLCLRMTTETEIGIVFDEQHPVDRSMGVVTNRATFPQRFVFKDKWTSLCLMALRAGLVLTGHRQTARRFKNIAAMWIMTIHAIHMALDDRMMLWQC